jgi:CHAT domain-containing protein/Tfp pilus assembly protein PilF
MGNQSGHGIRKLAAPLLILLLTVGITAAPFSSQKAYRDARAAADRRLDADAAGQVEAALKRAGAAEDEWVWALRILKKEIAINQKKADLSAVAPELPPKFRTSEAALRRLLVLGREDTAHLGPAKKLAETKYPELLWTVYLTLGGVAGTEKEKEAHFRTALALAERDRNRLAIAIIHSSRVYQLTGAKRYREALDVGRLALDMLTEAGATGRLAVATGNVGWAYIDVGDLENAREYFDRAKAMAAHAGTSQVPWQNQLGNVFFAQGKFAEAEREYLRALDLARSESSGDPAGILNNLTRTALEQGRVAEARRRMAGALTAARGTKSEFGALILDARIATEDGDYARAEKTFRQVIKDAGPKEWSAYGYLAELYVRMRRNDAAEAAFRLAIDTVGAARAEITDSELRLSFFNVSGRTFSSYIDFLVQNQRIQQALAATELIRAQSLEEGLGIKPAAQPLKPPEIAKQRNATILNYWLGRERSHLWIVAPAGVTYVPLPAEAQLERDIGAYRAGLRDSRQGTLEKSAPKGQALYKLLVAAAAPHIAKESRVIVIADGALHALNFETLIVPGAQPRYWIEDVVVSSASSLQLLAHKETKKNDAGSMLLIGDPQATDPAYPKLSYASKEIAQVGRHFPNPLVLAGGKATPASYRSSKPGRFAYLHFVAHGVASRRTPLDSAVILGRDATKEYKLFARDIVDQPLEARLVTISSCHGAGERTFAGEGLVGLAWAFMRAGAGEVIAALWEVNDSATPALMDSMYAQIQAGKDPAVALRNAKLTLVRGKTIFARAHYWAPFVLYSGS